MLKDSMSNITIENQFSSARQVAEFYEQERKKQVMLDNRRALKENAKQRRIQDEKDSRITQINIMKERDYSDTIRYHENKRLNHILIGIAVITAIITILK